MSTVSYSLKGFVGYGALANNNRFTTAPLGELSAHSITYAKDRELYSTNSGGSPSSSVDLHVFSSLKGDGTLAATPVPLSTFLLSVGGWIYRQAVAGSFNSDSDVFRQYILTEFDGKIINLTVGGMIQSGDRWMPGSISFEVAHENIPGNWGADADMMEEPRIRLWFSDDRFRREYDEYAFEFVSPLWPLELFFQHSVAVKEAIDEVRFSDLVNQAADKAEDNPYTRFRPEVFNYQDPTDPSYKFPTDWGILIWGDAGNNIDAIKERLITWILANSNRTREEWARIFPDIFTATEFVIAPFWNQFAVENMTVQAGVYSPVVSPVVAELVAQAVATGTGYTDEHVSENYQIWPFPYKSLGVTSIGGPENRNGRDRITDYYPDYMNVTSQHPDFGRMSPETRGLILMLEEMFQAAETTTEFSSIPPGMTRMTRTNRQGRPVLYLVRSYRDVQYLVVCASTIQTLFPPATYTPLILTPGGAEGLTSMPTGEVGVNYTTTFVAKGGSGGYYYSLPQAATGIVESHQIDPVTGVYTASFNGLGGDTTIRVHVRDSSMDTTFVDFRLHVSPASE